MSGVLKLVGRNWRGLEGRGHGRRQSTGDPTPRVAPPRDDPKNLRGDQGRTLWSAIPPLFCGPRAATLIGNIQGGATVRLTFGMDNVSRPERDSPVRLVACSGYRSRCLPFSREGE